MEDHKYEWPKVTPETLGWKHGGVQRGEMPLISSGRWGGESPFFTEYFCTPTIDQGIIDLENRLVDYYKTTDGCSNKEFRGHYKEFVEFTRTMGYTKDEVRMAKERVLARNDI